MYNYSDIKNYWNKFFNDYAADVKSFWNNYLETIEKIYKNKEILFIIQRVIKNNFIYLLFN